MPLGYRVHVYRNDLSAQFQPGGQGGRWLDRLRLRMHRAAENEARGFQRSGQIVRGHRSSIRGVNQWACEATISNVAEHAGWVHGGTLDSAPITPTSGTHLTLRPYGQYGWVRKGAVRGQAPNPWLDRVCTLYAIREGAVPIG